MEYDSSGYMQESVETLEEAVVGHRIVGVSQSGSEVRIVLDNGKVVVLEDTEDCCAYTYLHEFFLNVEQVDNIITSVHTEDNYETWFVLADLEQVLKLDVGWSEGSGYYGYGFKITVRDVV